MISAVEIIEILNKILVEKEPVRIKLIEDFQNRIFNEENISDEALCEIVADLAYNLDFYEPNDEWRKQDSSFFDGERLEEILKAEIIRIENLTKSTTG
jgi:hypothetical protein